jgi:cytochrome c oxidase cbb3-type subunit III
MKKIHISTFRLLSICLILIAFNGCSSSDSPKIELNLDESQLDTIYQAAANMGIEQIQADAQSMEVAAWLFSENCTSCHQADAKGRMGVPDLTDAFWLFEGTEESIRQTISQGRTGVMPKFSDVIGEVELGLLVSYVEALASSDELGASEASGKELYDQHCVICHADDGTGIANLGPNLTDEHWQWGGNMITLRQSIANGRTAECPSQEQLLSVQQINLLTAYTMSLSGS